jgi:hypothetical protein
VGELHLGGRNRDEPDLASLAGRPLVGQVDPAGDHQADAAVPKRYPERVAGGGLIEVQPLEVGHQALAEVQPLDLVERAGRAVVVDGVVVEPGALRFVRLASGGHRISAARPGA